MQFLFIFTSASLIQTAYNKLNCSAPLASKHTLQQSVDIRVVPISLFADHTDAEWNQWFKQPTTIMQPIVAPIIRWFFLTHSTLASKLFSLAVQGSGALLSSNLEGALYKSP